MVTLPDSGLDGDDIVAALQRKRDHDARWQDGRTFGLVFTAGPEVDALAERVATMFLHDNALNPAAFPSLAQIEREVVEISLDLMHGPDGAAGFMTSGGTESILMAVKAARERGRAERGITAPEIVLPISAHAAFHKAAHYFGMTVRPVPVDDGWRADVEAAAAAVNNNTVLVVGSAPQYPQGVIDPIPELAALARAAGASFHTDACMGGFVLPFQERLGEPVPPWDFRVDGVTTISADIHKLGYAPKGASVILHRSKASRSHQTFLFDDWLGGFYGSPNMQGTRLGMPMATAWAVLHHIGLDGYLRLTRDTLDATRRIADAVRRTPGLTILGDPQAHLLAIGSQPRDPEAGTAAQGLDVFAVGDGLHARGWHVDRQGPPDSLHLTVSAGNVPVIDDFLRDLAAAAEEAQDLAAQDRSTAYAGTD